MIKRSVQNELSRSEYTKKLWFDQNTVLTTPAHFTLNMIDRYLPRVHLRQLEVT
jgi:hypothetical protein